MKKLPAILAAIALTAATGVARAQYPIMDMVADKVIQKYQTSTCQQLWEEKAAGRRQCMKMARRQSPSRATISPMNSSRSSSATSSVPTRRN